MAEKLRFVPSTHDCPVCRKAKLIEVWRKSGPAYYHCTDTQVCKSRFEATHRIVGDLSTGIQFIECARLMPIDSKEFDLAPKELPQPSKPVKKKAKKRVVTYLE